MVPVENYFDALCNQCILIMENMSELTGLTYGAINIWLFCILGPLSTLFFMASTATAMFCKNAKTRKYATLFFSIAGILCVLMIVIPCIWALITL